MKAMQKDFFRELKKSRGRFISVFFIVLLGSAFFSGIRSSKPDMELSAEQYYDEVSLMDLKVLSPSGLTEDDISFLEGISGVGHVYGSYTLDALNTENEIEQAVKLISLNTDCNKPTVTEGRLPQKEEECFVDTKYLLQNHCEIGDTISFYTDSKTSPNLPLTQNEFTIVGSGHLPYYMDVSRGVGTVGNGQINSFALILPEVFAYPVYTEAYILADGVKTLNSFSSKYDDKISELSDTLSETAEKNQKTWYIQSRESISSYTGFQNDAKRIDKIGDVFPVIFFLVAALVSLTSMTRMVEEQRQQIGILKALGCNNRSITARYSCFAMLPTLLGSVTGVLIGEKFLPYIIIHAYAILYSGLPKIYLPYNFTQGMIAILASALCTGIATFAACGREFRQKPSELMRPQSPKAGKRVLLEHMRLIWKHLNFTQKSTVRNLFRYKKRFWMTLVGVGGCMGLILVAFGLHDSISTVGDKQFAHLRVYQASITLDSLSGDDTLNETAKKIADSSLTDDSLRILTRNLKAVHGSHSQDIVLQVPESPDRISNYIKLYDRISKKEYDFPENGAVISEKTAKSLEIKTGDTLKIENSDGSFKEIEISVISENYIGNYLYLSASEYERLFGSAPSYNQILLRYKDTSSENETDVGKFVMGLDGVKGILFTSTLISQTDDMLESLNTIVTVILIAAGLLAFVVLYNLNHINIAERQRELATLKVLGCYDREVGSYIFRENIILTILGILFGFILGTLLHQYVIVSLEVDLIMFGRSIAPLSYAMGSALTVLFTVLVNMVMSRRIREIDMIESLKSVE